ncbi:MAG: hypothetical protein JXB05_02485 [Myxococcaceae bacterium]|nr:hypothetical protein [Myxococcaceae bacterium]
MGTWLRWEGARLPEVGFQGIEYVTLEGPASGLSVLRVKLKHPAAGLRAGSFEVRGSSSGQPLSWSVRPFTEDATEVALTLSGASEDVTYEVRLLDGGALALHSFFSTAEFRFAIDRDRGDMRAPVEQAAPTRAKRPAVDLLTKDYNGFVQLLSDRVRVLNPHWADLSPSSLERVLVELLSHHADLLSYFQDRVATEAFVALATQRHSLRQHGLLLDYVLFEGSAAETVMAFEAQHDGYLPAGLSFRAEGETGEARVVFYLPERARVVKAHSRLRLAAWPGALDAELPEGVSEVLLWGRVEGLTSGQRLAFVQGTTTQLVHVVSARPARLQGWAESPRAPEDPDAAREPRELTVVAFHPPLATSLRPFAEDFALHGNLALARHGEERVAHYRPASGRALPRTHLVLADDRQNTLRAMGESQRLLLRALRIPGPVLFTQQQGGQVPLLEVSVGGRPWTRVEHLHRSQSFHPHFVATADEDGAVWLQFGDGVRGLAVEDATADIEVRYRMGAPVAGNCAPGSLTGLVPPEDAAARAQLEQLGLERMFNVTPGAGGRQPETKDAARLAMAASVRRSAGQRAISLEDCAEVARSVPGVARAVARLVGGPFHTVQVLVDPQGRSELPAELEATVRERLEATRLAGREIRVVGPRYVPLVLELVVAARAGVAPFQVREAVTAALRPGSPTHPGLFHPDKLDFGEAVELGRILAHVQQVSGVRAVRVTRLCRLVDLLDGSAPASVPQRLVLEPLEIAQLDGDPEYPQRGRLQVRVVGIDAQEEELSP